MNKKILAILMALLMVLTSVAAFAEGEGTTTSKNPVGINEIVATKTYTGNKENVTAPTEVFNFKVTPVDNTTVALNDVATDAITATGTVVEATSKIDLTKCVELGKYNYTITEVVPETQTAGVTYNENKEEYTVLVQVLAELGENDIPTGQVVRNVIMKNKAGTKVEKAAFENKYEAGSLTVKKSIEGNMATKTDKATVTVTFTAKAGTEVKSAIGVAAGDVTATPSTTDASWTTCTYTLTNVTNASEIVFTNVPSGVSFEVKQTAQNDDNVTKTYTTTYEPTTTTGTVAADSADVITIIDTATEEIATGVFTDNMPYFMLLAFVMILAAAVVLKKRTVNE